MAPKYPGRGAEQFALRLPDGLRDRIRDAASAGGRSMNAEIVATLLEAYPEPNPGKRVPLRQVLESMRATLADPPEGTPEGDLDGIRAYIEAKERAIAADPTLADRETFVAYDNAPHEEPE